MENEGEHIKEVYAHYGLAMYEAQVLEHGIVNALLRLDLFRNAKPELHAAGASKVEMYTVFDEYMADRFKDTIGRMITRFKGVTAIPGDLEQRLQEAKDRRNFLAHHFWRERAHSMTTTEERERLLAELQMDQNLFRDVDAIITQMARAATPGVAPKGSF